MREMFLLTAALSISCAAHAQYNLEEAKKEFPDLRILAPAQVRTLPPAIREDLARRGCKVPIFTKWDGAHNAIRGQFARAGQQDLAVLCLHGDDMSVMVYWGGAVDKAEETRKFAANALRMIHAVTPFVLKKRAIRDEAEERLPDFDHDAIEDGPLGGHAETVYFQDGQWLTVF